MSPSADRNPASRELSSSRPWQQPGFEWLAEAIPDVLMIYDVDGRLRYLNRTVDIEHGSSADEMLGLRPSESSRRDSEKLVDYEQRICRVIATGESDCLEVPFSDGAGDQRTHLVRIQALRSSQGSITGALAVGRDITELVTARREVVDREHEFRSLAENLPDIVVRYDLDGRAVYASNQLMQLVDADAADVVGRRPTDGAPPGMVGIEEYERRLLGVIASGHPDSVDLQFVDSSGQTRVHSVLFRAERDPAGTIIGALAIGRDVTDHIKAEQEISAREHQFRSLAENLPDLVIRYDRDGRARYLNRHLFAEGDRQHRVLGLRPAEIPQSDVFGLDAYQDCLDHTLATGQSGNVEMRMVDTVGGMRTHSVRMVAEHDAAGDIIGALAIGRDVTDLVEARQAAAAREREFRSLSENATDLIGRWDTNGRRIYLNPALAALYNRPATELVGTMMTGGPDGAFSAMSDAIRAVVRDGRQVAINQEFVNQADGRWYVHHVRFVPEFDADDQLVSVLGIGRDITELVEQRDALERVARTDSLTGVASRQVLYRRFPELLVDRVTGGGRGALLLVDLDGFKAVNDQYGHRLGDRILREVAGRLEGCLRHGDLVVRLGGDEFVVLIPLIDGPTTASRLAGKIREVVTDLTSADEIPLPPLDACIGVAVFPDDADDIDDLLAHADLALYEAKRRGRGRVEFFRPELRACMERRVAIERALVDCDHDAELAVHLQPICTLGARPGLWGAEALLRWDCPELGTITPDEFIAVAEQCGQIIPIGRWVLRRAAELAVRFNRHGARSGAVEPLRITVNVSTRQFTLGDIATAMGETLAETGCDPGWLVVELTESLLLEDMPVVKENLEALYRLGVATALDDFGTGYSALEYLTRLRIDYMKIDKAFVRGVEDDRQQQGVVRAVIALADALGIGIIAEGIETVGQAAFLESEGCQLAQGFLLARPMPVDRFARWLEEGSPARRREPAGGEPGGAGPR